jgi:hypothetical protein
MLIFIIFRIGTYIRLGNLPNGNIPKYAPEIIHVINLRLVELFTLSLLILLIYFTISWTWIIKGKFRKLDYIGLLFVIISNFMFWFFDFGANWLFD